MPRLVDRPHISAMRIDADDYLESLLLAKTLPCLAEPGRNGPMVK
jgi:hypothetical protein